MADDTCEKCGKTIPIGGWPWCDHRVGQAPTVLPDDLGQTITCETMGHEPVSYSTRSERKRLMKLHGVEEFVRHVGTQGSDKSPHTTRWI